MNMAFFHDSKFKYEDNKYYTSGGLNNRFLKEYLDHFNEVTLITRREKIKEDDDISKYSIIDLDSINFDCLDNLRIISILFGKSKKTIEKNIINHDFIIVRLPSIIGIQACHLCNKYKKNYLVEMVGCPFDALWNYGGIKAKIFAPIMYIINKFLIKKAPNVLYVSKKFLQERYPSKCNTIGVSDVKIDFPDLSILEKRIERIEKYDKNTVYKFGLIGSLKVNYKGHDTAIKALARIKDNIKFELHFLGTNNEASIKKWSNLAKKHGIQDKLFFDGVLPGGKPVLNWIDNIDIYLIPSLTEGLPRALVEAMSRASVCIGVKAGGIPELLSQNMIVSKKDYKNMSKLIVKLLNDKKTMIDEAKNNFNKSKNYTENRLTQQRYNFLENIILDIK